VSPTDGPVILCYDGSRGSREAIAAAGALLPGRRAIVLHALESLAPGVFHEQEPPETGHGRRLLHIPGLRAAERLVEDGCERARRAGFDATPLVEVTPGRASDRLLEVAEEYGAAVIVVGARGLSTLRSILLGSVSSAVVHGASCPVLVVRGDAARA
jgi:nucleotide-binding universal stress UspA family protein